jgi:hypothetical protein
MYERKTSPLLPFPAFVARVVRHLGAIAVLIVVSLAVGMAGYRVLAGMRWVDSFLNAAMILGGMGPVGDLPNNTAKIFAGCYALYSGLLLIAIAGIMLAPIAHRLMHRLHIDDEK